MFGQLVNMMTLLHRGRKVWAVLALVICLASPAQSFYWPGWPGSKVIEPPVDKPKETEDPKIPPVPKDPPDPKQVPEPATLVLAGLGLGILSLRKAWKRRQG